MSAHWRLSRPRQG